MKKGMIKDIDPNKQTIACWFSCGVASAIAAWETIKQYGETHNILVVNTPVVEEHPDNERFLNEWSDYIGYEIIKAVPKKYPVPSAESVWIARKYMSGVRGAVCTVRLKKQARYEFELLVKIDFHVLGYTSEESERLKRFMKFERENVIDILGMLNISKLRAHRILRKTGIKAPAIYSLGFANANCIGCVKVTSPTYWNRVRRLFPMVFKARAVLSRALNVRLVEYKGKRIFLDELPENARGREIKSPECSIFCELPFSDSL